MNQLQRNFYFVIENWVGQWRVYCMHRRDIKQIRRHRRELNYRKQEADELHKATKKTYYVLQDYNKVLQVMDKSNIKNLKRAKIMSKDVTVIDLLTESEYNTMNNHFVVLMSRNSHSPADYQRWEFFRGTILECIDKYSKPSYSIGCEIQILGGFERVATIKDGKVIKH